MIFTPDPPVILQQPGGQTAWMGATVILKAGAGGPQPLSYQWLKNGTNLPGATTLFLTLTNLTRRDSAGYALLVSNGGGSVTSSNAVLKVLVPQRMSRPSVLPDGSCVLTSGDADGGLLLPGDLPGFEVQASVNLVDWVALTDALSLTNGWLRAHDSAATNHPARFYRLIEH